MCRPAADSILEGAVFLAVASMIEHEISTLLEAPAAGTDAPTLAQIEDTLTAGYARALALEAERWRLERRVSEIASDLDKSEVQLHSSELKTLARRMEGATADLANLRALLTLLRERAAEVRAAAAQPRRPSLR